MSPVRLLVLTIVLVTILFAAPAAHACLMTPTHPPDVTITGDACVDGVLQVRLHDYSTFAASAHNCSCALNIPLLVGNVVSAEVVHAGTNNTIGAFTFATDPNVAFSPPANWQGFSGFVASAVSGVEVDLVFQVVPSKLACDDFAPLLAQALRDPAEGVTVGTGGGPPNRPDDHVAVVAAGSVEINPGSAADACDAAQMRPCLVDLQSGWMSDACDANPYLKTLNGPADSNGDGWYESVMQVKLPKNCSRACVVLDYGADPTGFTVNIGDSATNNGHGGNSSSDPTNAAEVQIHNEKLTVWSAALGAGQLNRMPVQQLALADGSYKICVSDQRVTLGQPASRIETPFPNSTPLLFTLPDPFDGNRSLFIGLNRVVSSISGNPSPANRTGAGLEHALITID